MFGSAGGAPWISFKDKVVIVTGAGHGFGKAICKEFARNGASVFGTDLSEDASYISGQIISADGGNHMF